MESRRTPPEVVTPAQWRTWLAVVVPDIVPTRSAGPNIGTGSELEPEPELEPESGSEPGSEFVGWASRCAGSLAAMLSTTAVAREPTAHCCLQRRPTEMSDSSANVRYHKL